MHFLQREIPRNHHAFVLFDRPQIGNSMTPVWTTRSRFLRTNLTIGFQLFGWFPFKSKKFTEKSPLWILQGCYFGAWVFPYISLTYRRLPCKGSIHEQGLLHFRLNGTYPLHVRITEQKPYILHFRYLKMLVDSRVLRCFASGVKRWSHSPKTQRHTTFLWVVFLSRGWEKEGVPNFLIGSDVAGWCWWMQFAACICV